MAPRFSQELFDLIIDEAASEGKEEWPYVQKYDECERYFGTDEDPRRALLKSFSLVCKSWYSRASKHLWWGVTIIAKRHPIISNLRSVLTAKPELGLLVKHVALHAELPMTRIEDDMQTLSLLLAPTTSFMLLCHGRHWRSQTLKAESWNNDAPFIRAITPFCQSNTLTSLFYGGLFFPTKLLDNIPNLRNFTLHNSQKSDPTIANSPTFRLQRAHFCELSHDVYDTLILGAPQAFSQLEELIFKETVVSDELVDEESSARMLLLAKDTVQKVYVGKSSPITCASFLFCVYACACVSYSTTDLQHVFSKGPVSFPSLTHLTFKLEALLFNDDLWTQLQNHLGGNSSLCSNLQNLNLFVKYAMYGDFMKLKEPNHIAWTTMQKILGPEKFPVLKEVSLGMSYTAWSKAEYCESEDEDCDDDGAVAKEVEAEIAARCLPTWEGDHRELSFHFTSKYFDEDPQDYDSESD